MFLAMTAADSLVDWSPDLQAFITLQSNWSRSSYNCCRSNVPAVDLLRKHLEQMKVNIASGLHAAWGSGRSFSSLNTGISTGSAPAKPLGMLVLELATLLRRKLASWQRWLQHQRGTFWLTHLRHHSISFVVGSSKTAVSLSGRFSATLANQLKNQIIPTPTHKVTSKTKMLLLPPSKVESHPCKWSWIRLKAPARALWLTLRTKTRPGLSAPSKHPFDLLYKPSKPIKDLILAAAKRFVPMSAGFEWPLMLHNFSIPFPTISCNHKMRKLKCLKCPTPLRFKIPLAPLLSVTVSVDVDMGSFVGDSCQQPGK